MPDPPTTADPPASCPCTGCRGATRIDLFRSQLGQVYKNNGNDYYTGEQYISALNHFLGQGNWSDRVLEHGYDELGDEFWALVELEATIWYHADDDSLIAQKVVKQQFGGQSVKRSRSTGQPLSTADDRKAAATDGLKKCASLLGFGLDLWVKNPQADLPYRRPEDQPIPGASGRATTPRNGPARATGGPVRASNAPAGGGGQPDPDTAVLVQRYVALVQDALDQGFSKSWASQDPARLTAPQLERYIHDLEAYLESAATGAA